MSTLKVSTIAPLGTDATKTITLGESGGILQPATGVTNNLGIIEADQFRLTAQLQANADPISSNLERVDDATFAKIGTGMSLSSGVYTFPRTGLYLVGCHAEFQISQDIGAECQTHVSTDSGGSYDIVATAMGGEQSSSFAHFTSYSAVYINVTNASTFRVKFKADGFASSDTRLRGDTGYNMTSFDFIRLGDSQ